MKKYLLLIFLLLNLIFIITSVNAKSTVNIDKLVIEGYNLDLTYSINIDQDGGGTYYLGVKIMDEDSQTPIYSRCIENPRNNPQSTLDCVSSYFLVEIGTFSNSVNIEVPKHEDYIGEHMKVLLEIRERGFVVDSDSEEFIIETSEIDSNICSDSDGGKDVDTYGKAVSTDGTEQQDTCATSGSLNSPHTVVDSCDGTDCYLLEAECKEGEATYAKLACSKGCNDGVCYDSNTLNVEYKLITEGTQYYYLYIKPLYSGRFIDEIYVTGGFLDLGPGGGSNRVKSWSNDPNNRFITKFYYDKDLAAYKSGSISKSELSEFNTLSITLRYKSSDRIWKTPLNDVKVIKLERKNPDISTGPIEIPVVQEDTEQLISITICNGCEFENKCYPLGYRLPGKYCSISEKFVLQSKQGEKCSNNFECESNKCQGDKCSPICEGCLDENNVCIPISTRTETQYCDTDFNFKNQKSEDMSCNNNYECSTNICVNNECISPSFIQKIMDWFRKLFG